MSRYFQRVNRLIPWSAIAAVGNSTPVRLTALAPLIGYLIIYNQLIADFFFLSKSSSAVILEHPTRFDLFRELKLAFLYFGLLFFGIGSISFSLFAPKSVRKYKTPEEYVLAMEGAKTEWLIIDNFKRVSRAALNGEIISDEYPYGSTNLSFTEDTFAQLDTILEFSGHNVPYGVGEDGESMGIEPADGGFYDARANVIRERVLDCILNQRRAERAVWHELFGTIADNRARDVFYMTYAYDEWSKFFWRISCVVMFGFGSLLLVIPTVITSIEVASHVWK